MDQVGKAPGGEAKMIKTHKLWKKFGRHVAVRDLSFAIW